MQDSDSKAGTHDLSVIEVEYRLRPTTTLIQAAELLWSLCGNEDELKDKCNSRSVEMKMNEKLRRKYS